MKPGIYKIFGVFPDESGEKLIQYGRLLVTDTDTYVVEDNRHFIEGMLPDGPIDQMKKKRWTQMTHSPYMRIEPDELGKPVENHHTGDPKPEALFVLLDQDGTNHRVEVFPGDNLWIDGSHVNEKQAKFIFEQVRIGRYKLLPK
jgi:hypothetical protein